MTEPNRAASASADDKRLLLRALLAVRDGGPAPLGPGPQALWFLSRLAPDSPAYNFVFAGETPLAIDPAALSAALAEVAERHPALRSRFALYEKTPSQFLDAPPAIVEAVPFADRGEGDLQAAIAAEADRPFDLEAGPAYRIRLYDCGTRRVLVFVAHHIIADLWSMDLLIEELGRLYGNQIGRASQALALSGPSPAEIVRDQMAEALGPRGQKSLAYWLAELAGDLPVLNLPTDRPRPPVQTYAGRSFDWPLAPTHLNALMEYARPQGVTPFAALLGLFQLLLHRLTGQEDFATGITVADRAKPNWDRVVGYLLNQLPIRADFARPYPDFYALFQRTRDKVLEALDHPEYPFGLLVKKLQPVRDPSRPPIFQAMFIWDKPRPGEPDSALSLKPILMQQRGAPFDLTLVVFELETGLKASIRYNTDLFDGTTIRRFAAAFDLLLEAAASGGDRVPASVEIVRPEERDILLHRFNAPEVSQPEREPFLRRVAIRAERTPEAAAVRFADARLTYAELNDGVERLAGAMREAGVVPGDTVAIVLPRSPWFVVGLLASWRCGAVSCYCDPADPLPRLRDMLGELAPRIILGDADLPALWDCPILPPTAAGTVQPAASQSEDTPAYIVFTSGSTGKPKGVVLSHGGVENLSLAIETVLPTKAADRVSACFSFAFDASVVDVVMALDAGAELVIAPRESLLSGEAAFRFLSESRITTAVLTPALVARMPQRPLPELRRLMVAAEACPVELPNFWSVGREMFNLYGPSECTVWTTVDRLHPDRPPTIGRPIPNVRAYILDGELNTQPIGVPGELCLGGAAVGIGYLNDAFRTAEKFLPDPFADDPTALLYRTGDRARWLADGRIDLLGRIDSQIKIRGYRIEPDEVASVLREHPHVREAAVAVRTVAGESQLAVFAVLGDTPSPVAELREYLRERLPHYLIPSSLQIVAQLPLTRNGKIDRLALLALPQETREAVEARPLSPAETIVIEAVRRLLKAENAGPDDNFFELGGASIQVLELVAAAAAEGLRLTPDMVFRNPTLAELAQAATFGVTLPSGSAEHADIVEPIVPVHAEVPANITARIESLGGYLPAKSVSTREVIAGCKAKLAFPLERLTGILSRRMAGETEFSIDLAEKAARDCLARTRYNPAEIDLLICCNISRCDGPDFRFSLEPTTAANLRVRLGLSSALAFDINNACAGTFTGLGIADSLLKAGAVRTALVVSGEYITHLTRTAQIEIEQFMDPQIASLTLGDAGVALLLDRSPDPKIGFQSLDLFTLGKHHRLCVAGATDKPHGGARMTTDLVNGPAAAIKQAVAHAANALQNCGWEPTELDAIVMHQTSTTTLGGAVRAINDHYGRPVCTPANVVNNLTERGNTASTSHFLAVWEQMLAGRFDAGTKALFAITGSGQTVGTALYRFDDLAERVREGTTRATLPGAHRGNASFHDRPTVPVGIRAFGNAKVAADSTVMAIEAGADCLQKLAIDRSTIDLVLHTGIYRTDFLSEPAVAAIAAGELGINHDEDAPTGRPTFAFDVANGGAGTLTACYLAARMIGLGRFSRALLLASEADQNESANPDAILGIRRTASALLLDASAPGGFRAFGFRHFPEHLGAFASYTGAHNGIPAIFHSERDYAEVLAGCVETAIRDFLTVEGLKPATIDRIVLPHRLGRRAHSVADNLGFESTSVAPFAEGHGDPFTSSMAEALRGGLSLEGKRILFVEAGAGVVVACGFYEGAR